MFSDLFRIVTDHELSVPPEVAATFRALGVLEGTLDQLAPGFDLVAGARAFAAGHGPRSSTPSPPGRWPPTS
jgi:ubiquinone biosynthesis protein